MKHKNAEVIKAYIEGIECEFFGLITNQWLIIDKLETFDVFDQVRIKPEPKPDNVTYSTVYRYADDCSYVTHAIKNKIDSNNVKFVWDGETGKLKSAEVIKNV